ncbi:hypothetical protein CRE_01575 [Caenorhabditis remanei]|uniref:Uncharacterized protein n=1 Tax=Caenorhabditis remanei TaxID=31234 RepID=E3LGJ8_CAERE|nr:hypothetical protein CRE_01575 [Caenorhabditis remanei]
MSSIKTDITTTQKVDTDVETESQVNSMAGKDDGWFSMKKVIIIGVASIVSIATIALILYLTLPSSSEEYQKPTAQALIGVTKTTVAPSTSSTEGSQQTVAPVALVTSSNGSPTGSTENSQGVTESTVAPITRSTEDSQTKKLIFVQVLFRHGARAPGRLPKKYQKYFPRGGGELTDRGFNHSHLVGLFLKKRYVDSGFLNKSLVNHEMRWFSRQMSRVLSTASTIGSAMFRTPEQKYKTVGVVSRKDNDFLLTGGISKCKAKKKIIKKRCPGLLNKHSNSEIEALKCLDRKPKIFETFNVTDSDMYINMYRNNVPLPDNVLQHYKEIAAGYLEVRDFNNGVGDSELIQIRFGLIINKLLNDLTKAWESHLSNTTKRKFNAYSTQDWLIGGVLDAFSVLKYLQSILPKEEPNYSVMIVVELWEINGKPFVKFLYKPEEITEENHQLLDLTTRIPGCQGLEDCPLEVFNKCCDSHRLDLYTYLQKCRPKENHSKDSAEKDATYLDF